MRLTYQASGKLVLSLSEHLNINSKVIDRSEKEDDVGKGNDTIESDDIKDKMKDRQVDENNF